MPGPSVRAEDVRRRRGQDPLQRRDGRAHVGVVLPLDAARARRVAHVQRAVAGIDREHRAGRGGPRDAAVVVARGDRHRVGAHQRADEARVLVAQQQVRDLVVEQRVLAAARRRGHAVQDHRADPPRRRVVVAVGVPADRLVRVRDEVAAPASAPDRDAADAVVVGEPVAVEPRQAELRGERARQVLVGRGHRARVDGHVRAGAAVGERGVLVSRQRARIAHGHDEIARRGRRAGELRRAPRRVGVIGSQVERARRAAGPRRSSPGGAGVTRLRQHGRLPASGSASRRGGRPGRGAACRRRSAPRPR